MQSRWGRPQCADRRRQIAESQRRVCRPEIQRGGCDRTGWSDPLQYALARPDASARIVADVDDQSFGVGVFRHMFFKLVDPLIPVQRGNVFERVEPNISEYVAPR